LHYYYSIVSILTTTIACLFVLSFNRNQQYGKINETFLHHFAVGIAIVAFFFCPLLIVPQSSRGYAI
jgi:hypothetical protein